MPLLRDDDRLLRRALELAEEAATFASPNPAVGCVLVREGELLGEGAHRYDLRDHAEIVALKQAAASSRSVGGATAYVTLEPCAHHGRTGPCADALAVAGIARCVVATVDPNPLVRGQGLAKLRSAGVEVQVAEPPTEIARAARRLNDAFAFSIQHERPFVTLKAAVSPEGMLAPPPDTRTEAAPFWLSGPAARVDVQQLRHRTDALVSGIGTVMADDPELTDRMGLPRRRPLLRAILDSELRIPLNSKLVCSAAGDLLVFGLSGCMEARAEALRGLGAEVVTVGPYRGRMSLDGVLGYLYGRGLRSVLLEAGSELNAAFLNANLVDRVVLYRSPVRLGAGALPFARGSPSVDKLLARLSGVEERHLARPDGRDDIRLSGYLHDPWAGLSPDPNAVL